MTLTEDYKIKCDFLGLDVDPFVLTSLATDWKYMKASNRFSLLPLLQVLKNESSRKKVKLRDTLEILRLKRATCACHKGHLADSNARVIAEMLMICSSLKEVSFHHAGLSKYGALEIAKAISHSDSIEVLDLSFNAGCADGLSDGTFEESLSTNVSLRTLNVTNNQLGFSVVNRFNNAMKRSHGEDPFEIIDDGNNVFEEVMNALTHLVGILFSFVGTSILMYHASGQPAIVYYASSVYCVSLVVLFTASTVLHATFLLPKCLNDAAGLIDHIAIYLLIAGTYTPIALISLRENPLGIKIVVAEWSLAALGIGLTLFSARHHVPYKVAIELVLYLAMGHMVYFVWDDFVQHVDPGAIDYLKYGGFCYTFGVAFFIAEKAHHPLHHAIWHVFVLAGAAFHYLCILFFVVGTEEPHNATCLTN